VKQERSCDDLTGFRELRAVAISKSSHMEDRYSETVATRHYLRSLFQLRFVYSFLRMCTQWWITVFVAMVVWPTLGHAEDLVKEVKKAVERSTLDQAGTKSFHLKAVLAPSFERDKESGRTGEVEIWWASPTQWKREVRSPGFHQIEIVDGGHDWQKNEGDFFPEWLRETAVELIKPVPPLEQVLEQVKKAEMLRMGPMTNLSWTTTSGTAEAQNILRSSIALQDSTGLLLYAGGLGWGGEFKDYQSFHGRMIARTVSVGSPEVTAKVTTLEALGEIPAGFFEAGAKGGDPQPLETVLLDETSLRKNLLPMEPLAWPPLQDGSLEGNVTTEVIVDRDGKVREFGTIVSENPGINDAGRQAIAALRFKPFVVNGVPVQAMSQITIPFKTVRPAGVETFESARAYFERGRHASLPVAGNGTPYVMRAEFEAKGNSGTVEKGRYVDTWASATQWRREAWFGKSRYVRSRNGDKGYQFAEGQDAGLLPLVFRILEPIPTTTGAFVESDWRIKRDTVNGLRTVRVLAGYESPEGKLDPEQARGYWFDDTGLLVKTYFDGIETQRLEFEDFAGVKTARRIDVLKDGKLAMLIRVTEVSPAGTVPAKTFEVRGHEWTRSFTAEVR
jgi:TonB-like protein